MKILVTGCQRSGTRFYAKLLARKQGLNYIDEAAYDVRDVEKLHGLLNGKDGWCVHGPAVKHIVKEFAHKYPDCQIIWMKRGKSETVASMERIGWARSALVELTELATALSIERIPKALWGEIYRLVRDLSAQLGSVYQAQGLVTVKDMSELESLEGFKKHGDTSTDNG